MGIPGKKFPRRHLLIISLSKRQGQDAQTLTQALSPGGLLIFARGYGNLEPGEACL